MTGRASRRGTLEAAGESDARETLRRQGLFATKIVPASDALAAGTMPSRSKNRGSNLRHLAGFTRQLHVLVSSGTPMVQALGALERQAVAGHWREVVAKLRHSVEEGSSLSRAMHEQSDVFDAVSRSLVAAGESGGKLDVMLDRLSNVTRKQAHVRTAVRGAMVYPCLLMVIAIGVLIVMLTFVLPRFAELFKTLGTPLPPTTKFVMGISDLLRSYWWGLIAAGVAMVFAVRAWLKTTPGKRVIDTAMVKLPGLGPLVRNFAAARIARLLGVQLLGHVPLLEALQLTREAMQNVLFCELINSAEDAAVEGRSISDAFGRGGLLSPAICEAMRSGEQTGQMGLLLTNIADFLDEDNDVVIKSLTSIIEPIILVVLGALVGFVALSLFLPLFDLTSAMNGGGH